MEGIVVVLAGHALGLCVVIPLPIVKLRLKVLSAKNSYRVAVSVLISGRDGIQNSLSRQGLVWKYVAQIKPRCSE